MTTLREQIEALFAAHRPYGGTVDADDIRAAVLDIIDQHECYDPEERANWYHMGRARGLREASLPDRDALARVMHQTQIIGCIASDAWGRDCDGQCRDEADAIIAALKKQQGGHAQLPIGPDAMRNGWGEKEKPK